MTEVDHKFVELSRRWERQQPRLLTVDFNLAHVARAQNVKVLNVNDIAQALKVSLMPGEEFTVRITHEGKERAQGIGCCRTAPWWSWMTRGSALGKMFSSLSPKFIRRLQDSFFSP